MFEVYDVVIEECCTGECHITAIVSRAVVLDITDFFLYLPWAIQNNNNNNFLVVVFTFCVQQGARLQHILQQWWFKPWQIFWDTANDFPVNGCMRKCKDIVLSIVLKSVVSVSFPVILTGRPVSFFLHKSMSFRTDCTLSIGTQLGVLHAPCSNIFNHMIQYKWIRQWFYIWNPSHWNVVWHKIKQ